jgi:hypothetical protein
MPSRRTLRSPEGAATLMQKISGEVFTFGVELGLCPLISDGPTG